MEYQFSAVTFAACASVFNDADVDVLCLQETKNESSHIVFVYFYVVEFIFSALPSNQ